MMNCKVGDLAIWLRRGVIVEVIAAPKASWIFMSESGQLARFGITKGRAEWRCRMVGSPQGLTGRPKLGFFREIPIFDSGLRPIRDQPGEDETLQWAGLPQDAGVTA